MVKVNLLNKQASEPEEPNDLLNNEDTAVPDMSNPSEPEPEPSAKKGGVLKI